MTSYLLIEDSINIAWDFLERSGELGEPEAASRILLALVEGMIRSGERRRLVLSNKAIDAFRQYKSRQHLILIQ